MSSGTSKWVKLNVGGQLFQTTLTTLLSCPDSLLAKMFDPESGLEPAYSEDGVFFLDSDPKYFSVILNWLRYKKVMVDPDTDPNNVAEVAEFFGIEELVEKLKFAGAIVIVSDEGKTSYFYGWSIGLYFKENGNIREGEFILRNASSTKSSVLPREDWEYYDKDNGWIKDASLRIIDATKFNFCNSIVLSSTKYSKKEFLGEFRRVPQDWFCGWPAFRNKEGSELGVFHSPYWSVNTERRCHFEIKFISSNRVTSCPARVNAGVNDWYNHWQIKDEGANDWIDDDTLKVQCDVHS